MSSITGVNLSRCSADNPCVAPDPVVSHFPNMKLQSSANTVVDENITMAVATMDENFIVCLIEN